MKRKDDKGFAFTLDKEKILSTYNLSAEDKLNWLEEANCFVNASMTPAKRKRWEKIKHGVL
jgi:hypothetical protein